MASTPRPVMMKIEGIAFKATPEGEMEFTINAPFLIESVQQLKNNNGFIDGKLTPVVKVSEKGYTHLAYTKVYPETVG